MNKKIIELLEMKQDVEHAIIEVVFEQSSISVEDLKNKIDNVTRKKSDYEYSKIANGGFAGSGEGDALTKSISDLKNIPTDPTAVMNSPLGQESKARLAKQTELKYSNIPHAKIGEPKNKVNSLRTSIENIHNRIRKNDTQNYMDHERERQKKKLAVYGTVAGVLGGAYAIDKVLEYRQKKRWKEQGCSKIQDSGEKYDCIAYLKSLKDK